MKNVPEEKNISQKALDYALRAVVWVKDDKGNYETIVPTNRPYSQNLSALAASLNQHESPIILYEPVEAFGAHRVVVKKEFAEAHNTPIVLEFKEHDLPPPDRSITQSLLMLLNCECEKEDGLKKGESLYHTALPLGESARGIYTYLRYALGEKPELLSDWNGANIFFRDKHRDEVHFHLGEKLASGLFSTGLPELIAWRRSLDPHLPKKNAPMPEKIMASTDFSVLRDALSETPETQICTRTSEPNRIRDKDTQIDFGSS